MVGSWSDSAGSSGLGRRRGRRRSRGRWRSSGGLRWSSRSRRSASASTRFPGAPCLSKKPAWRPSPWRAGRRRPGHGRPVPPGVCAKDAEEGTLCALVVAAKEAVIADNSTAAHLVKPQDVPADAVTSSGSGLDPNISPAYATLQVHRVAEQNNLDVKQVEKLVADHTTGRTLGFMGEPRVNVLELNIALKALSKG
ncbi:hypothetical protein SAVIM40S_03930 [Streptomyces avidinii]